jgi:hypothetical protein
MSTSTEQPTRARVSPADWGRPTIVVATVAVAVVVNVLIYAVGRAFGGDFVFTNAGEQIQVTALSVVTLTAGPLALGMALVALLSMRWPAVVKAGLVIGPALALVTIAILTLPADLDTTSTITLSLDHVALVPMTIAGLLALGRRAR